MKIKGTEWYTAMGRKMEVKSFHDQDDDESTYVPVTLYGYRMPIQGRKPQDINDLRELLKADGVDTKLRSSKHNHTGIPAGTPFLEVLDEKSAIALEKIFLKEGIVLETDRYKEYGLEYINRTPKQVSPVVKRSFFDRLFGRK